jgi:hypothetical protein
MVSAPTLPERHRLVELGQWIASILTLVLQSLKETFAAKIPENVEKIKKLKKYVVTQSIPARSSHIHHTSEIFADEHQIESMAARSSVKLHSTKFMVVQEA